MHWVGFEPTQLTLPDLKSGSLDHSDINADSFTTFRSFLKSVKGPRNHAHYNGSPYSPVSIFVFLNSIDPYRWFKPSFRRLNLFHYLTQNLYNAQRFILLNSSVLSPLLPLSRLRLWDTVCGVMSLHFLIVICPSPHITVISLTTVSIGDSRFYHLWVTTYGLDISISSRLLGLTQGTCLFPPHPMWGSNPRPHA